MCSDGKGTIKWEQYKINDIIFGVFCFFPYFCNASKTNTLMIYEKIDDIGCVCRILLRTHGFIADYREDS
jgi:hypothetical protein